MWPSHKFQPRPFVLPQVPSHIRQLEAEAIHIVREALAECERPVLLYSIGKDSSALLHLCLKAVAPGKLPIPTVHVDTGWKFREMIEFRDRTAREFGLDLIVYTNPDGAARGISPLTDGSHVHTQVMKTEALRQVLDLHKFDCAIAGARRDEERSRAKERIFSLRGPGHRWDPKSQRPELWNLFNGRHRAGETLRVFPLSNWTEQDVWSYIRAESIPVVPLYFAAERPIVARDGSLIMADDSRLTLRPGEQVTNRRVRFRTLGCYPLTGAIESDAVTIDEVIEELRRSRFSERQGRIIDNDPGQSMERKKREGYF